MGGKTAHTERRRKKAGSFEHRNEKVGKRPDSFFNDSRPHRGGKRAD
jgi:hypothetical protein